MKILFFNTALFSILFFNGCSCSKEINYGPQEMWKIANKFDPTIELVGIPDHEGHRRVLCQNYRADGCKLGSGKRIKVRLVELLVIQYETSKQACLAAQQIGQWYAANWVFDDVTNEPVLESFVKDAFQGLRPENISDCP